VKPLGPLERLPEKLLDRRVRAPPSAHDDEEDDEGG
jgi:hypothetical protein